MFYIRDLQYERLYRWSVFTVSYSDCAHVWVLSQMIHSLVLQFVEDRSERKREIGTEEFGMRFRVGAEEVGGVVSYIVYFKLNTTLKED